jgi:hypothetical protein
MERRDYKGIRKIECEETGRRKYRAEKIQSGENTERAFLERRNRAKSGENTERKKYSAKKQSGETERAFLERETERRAEKIQCEETVRRNRAKRRGEIFRAKSGELIRS